LFVLPSAESFRTRRGERASTGDVDRGNSTALGVVARSVVNNASGGPREPGSDVASCKLPLSALFDP